MVFHVRSKTRSDPVSTASRASALMQLDTFAKKVNAYAAGRNFDRPNNQSVSMLSPFIRHRLVAEREVVQHVLKETDYASAAKFIEEVCWRTYWKGYLEMRPGIWGKYLRDTRRLAGSGDEVLRERIRAARSGQTGIEPFDTWVEELKKTGWLHNHARMWFASIWIFTLELPWQAGAAFFLEHLLDGDPASNTLSWRWVAGLHTRGKHYLARADNIRRHTDGRFNPHGLLNESAEPLPADGSFESLPFAPVCSLRDVQFPSLSNCPSGFLVTPEDLSPEFSELSETPFSSICVLNADDILDTIKASPKVRAFVSDAVDDAGDRLARHWDGKVIESRKEVIPMVGKASPDNVGRRERMRVYAGTVDKWIDGVLVWSANENLKSVWMMRPPVGPWNDALPALKKALEGRGVALLEYRRRWDSLHWPHATHGYFRFKDGLEARVRRAIS